MWRGGRRRGPGAGQGAGRGSTGCLSGLSPRLREAGAPARRPPRGARPRPPSRAGEPPSPPLTGRRVRSFGPCWRVARVGVAGGACGAGANAANLLLGEERCVKTPGPDMLNIRHRRQLK